jgi:hypothetical protein
MRISDVPEPGVGSRGCEIAAEFPQQPHQQLSDGLTFRLPVS